MALVKVTYHWDDKHGPCYDCGNPAAFFLPRAYVRMGEEPEEPNDINKRCALCAANAAADGEQVEWIDPDHD